MTDQNQNQQSHKPYIQTTVSGVVPLGYDKKKNEIVYFSRLHGVWKTQAEIKKIREEAGHRHFGLLHFNNVGEIAENGYFFQNLDSTQQEVEFRGLAQARTEYKVKPVSADDIALARETLSAQKKMAGSIVIREVMGRDDFKTAYEALDSRLRLSHNFNEAALEAMPLGIFTGVSLVSFEKQNGMAGTIYSNFNAQSGGGLMFHPLDMFGGHSSKEKPMMMDAYPFDHINNFYELDARAKKESTTSLMEGRVISRWPEDMPSDNLCLVFGYERFDNQVHMNTKEFFNRVKDYARGIKHEGSQREAHANAIVARIPTPFL